METIRSLTENFDNNRIDHTEFRNSIQLLFDIDAKTQHHHHVDTELEDGEIREHHVFELIPEEEQCHVKYEVLNNKVSLVKGYAFEHKTLTEYETAMAICEEEMSEADVSMESLRSAVEKAEKVIKGEMKVGDLGVMFYTCIKELCHVDVFEHVRHDYKKALPKILPRLKQKLNELTVARAKKKSLLKQVMEDNTAKQRDSTAQGQDKPIIFLIISSVSV
ncbi:unnamed protein product [Eruca vesicaria subsp. sativa]|uniref:Histone deacetylase interacting domain-containing protein n=1 Tax=Eruca vesicaria subsp. sativa TaxID=29727 RepID=A0ABC8KTQ1_ERUVS|nr:unnamed protein product [Eruca vesicaria subsp. sativa]